MRCLHCGKRLSLLRKFSDGEFCSAEHRHLFHQQQSDLALARLIEAQNRIDRPKAKLPAPKPPAKPKTPEQQENVFPMAELVPEALLPTGTTKIFSPALELESLEHSVALPSPPLWLEMRGFPRKDALPIGSPQTLRGEYNPATPGRVLFRVGIIIPARESARREVRLAESGELFAISAGKAVKGSLQVRVPASTILTLDRLPRVLDSRLRVTPLELSPEPVRVEEAAPLMAERLQQLSVPDALNAQIRRVWPVLEWAHADSRNHPVCAVALTRITQSEIPDVPVEEIAPQLLDFALRVSLPEISNRVLTHAATQLDWARIETSKLCPTLAVTAGQLTLAQAGQVMIHEGSPAAGNLRTLHPPAPLEESEPAVCLPGMPQISAQALTPRMAEQQARLEVKSWAAAAGAGVFRLDSQAYTVDAEPGLPRLAAVGPDGAAIKMWEALQPVPQGQAAAGIAAAPRSSEETSRPVFETREVSGYPPAKLQTAPPEPSPIPEEAGEPVPGLVTRLFPLPPARATDAARKGPVSAVGAKAGCWDDSKNASPWIPGSKLTVDHADGSGSRHGKRGEGRNAGLLNFDSRRIPGRQFWSHAPADLKWVALGLPLLLVLVIYSFRGSTTQKAEPATQVAAAGGKTVLGGQLNSLQRVILNRAAVKLFDDFRGGLGSWQGTEGWSKSWKYGEASFLEPGQLALYAPSVGMKDYTLQFLGQVEKRSLNWVFRARDERNYYAMRIVITKAGPLPEAQVVRYMVMDGKEQNVKTLPIPFTVRIDTLYLVRMDVRGETFTTYIQGQVVDSFSDDRLSEGGVGFFSPKGDKSYLRWVEVTHQYDYIGRLCAMLAPYNMQPEGRRAE